MNTDDPSNYPLVSVVMSAYNHEKFVAKSIQSLLMQTYANLELIILDDGSQDNTCGEIEKFENVCKKRFVRYLFIKKANEGVAQTMNRGIGLTQGDYIIGASSDDVLSPDAFTTLVVTFLALDTDYAVVCGDADFIDANDQKIYLNDRGQSAHVRTPSYFLESFVSYYVNSLKNFSVERDFGSYSSLLKQNYIPSLCAIIRKRVLLDVGLYAAGISIEDFDLWLKISKKYKIKLIQKTLVHYRLHGSNASLSSRDDISADTLKLLLRERPYCRSSRRLLEIWDQRFFGLLCFLIKKRKIRALTRIRDLRIFFFLSIIYLKKLYRQIHSRIAKKDPSESISI